MKKYQLIVVGGGPGGYTAAFRAAELGMSVAIVDDNEETIIKRFETYLKDTLPIINYYRDLRLLHEIDGMNNISSIYANIRSIINSIET